MNALASDEKIQEALQAAQPPEATARRHWPLFGHLCFLIPLLVAYLLLRFDYFGLAQADHAVAQKAVDLVLTLSVIFTCARAIQVFVVGRVQDGATQYNLNRVVHLIALVLAFILVASQLFANLYAGLVSFGVISLVVGLAVQTPVTSFIGWIYLLVRAPYRVGDRIKIGDLKGDVIDVGYLDTTLWEFGGDYLSGDHPSGRIIRFPNSQVLEASVINYTWPLFPYIWNEVKFQVGYDSDLAFIASTMERIASEELGAQMPEQIRKYRELLARTPVDELEVKERPSASFRVSDNTWIEAMVRYLVLPRDSGRVKSRLLRRMLEALNAEPEKVRFPKGDSR
ncbi:MAG: mechanosensitive ion channel family protein [Vulcanimicrobiota bacterium]